MDNFIEFLVAISYVLGHEIYLLGSSYGGQQITDNANELFNAIYMSLWYKAPTTVQKLLLFMMQMCSKDVKASLGGIYVAVMESFSSVTSTAISFMTILYSLQ
ncbi:hypothetical protein P5V15_004472 [Pogonomyrmex californicus]